MTNLVAKKLAVSDYAFRFDALPGRITFTKKIKITGWLLHRGGLPIHGIRGIVRGFLRRRSIFRARRKRSRPLIAAAYPNLPEAGQSGFLLAVELRAGPNEITVQVQDDKKIWRPIFVTHIWAFPLTFLRFIGLPRVEGFLVTYLPQVFVGNRQGMRTQAISQGEHTSNNNRLQPFASQPISRTGDIKAVDLFVTSKSNLFIREIADLLCVGFRRAACEARLLVDQIPAEKTEEGKIQIVVTPHEFFNLFLRDTLSWEQMQRLTTHLFLLGTEQPQSEWFDSNLVFAPHARAMLDIHLSGVAAYRARGVRCFHLPLGYDPLLEQTDRSANLNRDIEVCLLAAMTKRREEFIAANADFFAAHNCHLRLVPIEFAKTEKTRSYLAAQRRNPLLQQTKILLNVHYSDLRYFEWHRALVAIANRCCLVTETCEGFDPFVPGKHFIMAKAVDLIAYCDYYLSHNEQREEIAEAAYGFVRERFTQANNCRAFLQQIEKAFAHQQVETALCFNNEDSNAQPSLQGEPLPAELATRLTRKPVALLASAFREDLSNMFRLSTGKPSSNDRRPVDAQTSTQRIATICEKRRGYSDRLEAQRKIENSGGTTFELSDNPLIHGSAPAISVIVTLYNYKTYIQQCLKSLEDSVIGNIPGGIEVVIVNDASTDDSLDLALALQEKSRHPVRIVNKRLNTGLADARNIGLQVARGSYVFIMDADNLVFPRALEQLYQTIVKDHSAAVYSMLCRFEDASNEREGLLSYFDWDPEMVVERPYIDAMALFDRRQLIEIGGYDTELYKIGWFGWEDYDAWLRIAQAGLHVSFVPNVLCLYRHHERAMSNTTNLFERELVTHLLAKYGSLLATYPPKSRILGVSRSRLEEQPSSGAKVSRGQMFHSTRQVEAGTPARR